MAFTATKSTTTRKSALFGAQGARMVVIQHYRNGELVSQACFPSPVSQKIEGTDLQFSQPGSQNQ